MGVACHLTRPISWAQSKLQFRRYPSHSAALNLRFSTNIAIVSDKIRKSWYPIEPWRFQWSWVIFKGEIDPDEPFFPRSSLIWSNYLTYQVRPTKSPKIICCFLSNRLEFQCDILHIYVIILSTQLPSAHKSLDEDDHLKYQQNYSVTFKELLNTAWHFSIDKINL